MTPASYCPGLLTGKYHFGVTVIDYGGESDDIIIISDGEITDESIRDKPEIGEAPKRQEIDERDFPQLEIVPTEETPTDKNIPPPPFIVPTPKTPDKKPESN